MAAGSPPLRRAGVPDERAWVPWAVLGVGLVSVALLIGSDAVQRRSSLRHLQVIQALAEVQTSVSLAHLWLEEYVSGDEIDGGEIFGRIRRARVLVEAMLGTAGGDLERIAIPPREGALLDQATRLLASIDEFEAIASERRQGFERQLPVGIGSALDVEYDRVFDRVLAQAGELGSGYGELMSRQRRRGRLIFLVIVSAWSAIVAVAATGLRNREQHRRRAEEALEHSREQLLRSQKLEALGRLAGGLAHDINNYLAAIRGHCELVRMKHHDGERLERKMDSVIRTVGRATTLLDRLLVFSRRQPMELEVVRLDRVIDGLAKMMQPSLGEDVRLTTGAAADLWNVEVDLAQIEQVLVNLLVNARDAMPTGGRIEVAAGNRSADGAEQVVVTVGDTGRGIPAADLDHIFEPFWSTKDKSRGGGLGLATAFAVVQQHGGSLEVASEVGRGTTFEIRLPRCRRPETLLPDDAATVEDALGGDERILLVDDNPDFRDSTRALLEALGYRVAAVGDGESALAAVDADGLPDLVLCDVVMPGMSGPELVEKIRERGAVEVIFVSGHPAEVAARYGLDPETAHLVKKQIAVTALAHEIRKVLDGSAGGGSQP
jgi:signal transduction histidine kinase